ncbi:MAG TPA: precorrin-6y C5,15-methyltransferase (decarboxylating) subunit CbiE [Stellaceae bacterium]|nr:precorrin-6y C5,15-methyltransferase (decarboxylating) subunit CbiE [Stellaceae bacterium]
MSAWLAVIGVGEDGAAGLSPAARVLVDGAELLVGGERHLALVPQGAAERLPWRQPLSDTLAAIEAWRDRRVVVLSSGDPLCYGVAATLSRHFRADEMLVLPQPSAFSLAASRLIWPLADCVMLTLHGRPLDALRLHLAPGARLLALTRDGETPAQVATLLTASGWGASAMTVLEHLGGARERRIDGTAAAWSSKPSAPLNTLAIECRAGAEARPLSRLAGLPDDAFEHDGQLTKRVVRAATLAALAPLPGDRLWDIGAGCGSVAIEWLRASRSLQAIAIERAAARCAFIARNAAALGVPDLRIVEGGAPAVLAGLPPPDAVFLGGGGSDATLWEAAWRALKPGGRLVANVVTLEGEAQLARWHGAHGGELTRITVSAAAPVGRRHGWRAQMTVPQLAVAKPRTLA